LAGIGVAVFFAWWNPTYVTLMLGSIGFNYAVGRALAQGADVGSTRRKRLNLWAVMPDLIRHPWRPRGTGLPVKPAMASHFCLANTILAPMALP